MKLEMYPLQEADMEYVGYFQIQVARHLGNPWEEGPSHLFAEIKGVCKLRPARL